ncbi:hypothetical protein [Bradyrhizobium yuanmingense]|uniref:hypothetical protein n=1 Tax=Bradyrhizobium yuanmingense TaxID=108015 RepID=UPI0023B9A094|nr:hypothetical protein [Bradyrhizobium yuanmingense]MDF0582135.1 hypothetical protein [Bradyrhizobium yuanmingense]
MPVDSWVNRAAPRIKSGEVNPHSIDAASALALTLGDPLLIRRPLIDVGGVRCAGLDREPVLSLLAGNTEDDTRYACTRQTARIARRPEEAERICKPSSEAKNDVFHFRLASREVSAGTETACRKRFA